MPEVRWTWNRYARPVPQPPRDLEGQRRHRERGDRNPERTLLDPGLEGRWEHLSRYLLAREWAAGRRVVDAGCGYGYGSALLLGLGAERVIGVDLDLEVLGAGARIVTPASPSFVAADLEKPPLRPGAVDLIVALEVFEHLPAPERFLDAARSLLGPEGALILSTPNRDLISPGWTIPPNRFHIREYNPFELRDLLSRFFPRVDLAGQIPGAALIARRRRGRRARSLAVGLERLVGWDPRLLLPASLRRSLRRLLGESVGERTGEASGAREGGASGTGDAASSEARPAGPEAVVLDRRIREWIARGLAAPDATLDGLYEYGPPEAGEQLVAICRMQAGPPAGFDPGGPRGERP